jgi:uncharacterized coiled-coil protein SlyX
VPSLRRSTIKPFRATAHEVPPKSIELEQRISRLELLVTELVRTTATQTTRITAMQAQLDHLIAKLTPRF